MPQDVIILERDEALTSLEFVSSAPITLHPGDLINATTVPTAWAQAIGLCYDSCVLEANQPQTIRVIRKGHATLSLLNQTQLPAATVAVKEDLIAAGYKFCY
jgi:hypothetical protein